MPWPEPRIADNGDGTVTDKLTGLMWQQDAQCIKNKYPEFDQDDIAGDGWVTWQHALDFAAGINSGVYPWCGADYTDWRLPNLRELHSLIDYEHSPALPDGHPFVDVHVGSYWTSTTVAHFPDRAWYVDTGRGNIELTLLKTYAHAAWYVRGGK